MWPNTSVILSVLSVGERGGLRRSDLIHRLYLKSAMLSNSVSFWATPFHPKNFLESSKRSREIGGHSMTSL